MNQKLIILLGLALIGLSGFILFGESTSSDKPLAGMDTKIAGWNTYTNEDYNFSFQYPPELKVDISRGSSDYDKSFVSVDIGTPEYIDSLKKIDGSEAIIFLRIGAHIPSDDSYEEKFCEGTTKYVSIDDLEAVQCETLILASFPSVDINFSKDDIDYSIESNDYSGEDKILIDRIIPTFKFIRK